MNGKKITKAVAATALAISVIMGGTTMACVQKNHKISSPEQVSTIAEKLNADMTVMTNNKEKQIYRLDHNNGEPIYVSIDESFTDKEKENITWSLDYVFDIVGEINDNYHYEIVSEEQRIKESKLGKSTIEYKESETQFSTDVGITHKADGSCYREKDVFSQLVNNPTYDNFVISYDREEHASSSDTIQKYTFLHELLHAFGFDDVYNATAMPGYINKFCGNTIMCDPIAIKPLH